MIGFKPAQNRAMKTKPRWEAWNQDAVVKGVKGSREVETADTILYVILSHLWGDHEYTKEQFQWNDAYSKQIDEDEVICWKEGDLQDGI